MCNADKLSQFWLLVKSDKAMKISLLFMLHKFAKLGFPFFAVVKRKKRKLLTEMQLRAAILTATSRFCKLCAGK
jgi:hypothetical protein